MTIGECLEQVDALAENLYSQAQKVRWLSDLDGQVANEVITTHEGGEGFAFAGYDEETDPGTELLVPAPYSDLYRWYLEFKIHLENGDMVRYNNALTLYNNAYLTYQDYYNRTHMPVARVRRFGV